MFKKMLGTMLKTAVPSLLKMGFDRMQQGGGPAPSPSGNITGLSALHAGILQKISGLTAANATLDSKLGILAATILLFWGVVVGPADSADHRAWLVVGSIMLALAFIISLAGMWARPLRRMVVDFGDDEYATYTKLDDQTLLRKLIATAETSVRVLHRANTLKAACYQYAILLFAGGVLAVTISLLRDSM
jgi:hypothetical protein